MEFTHSLFNFALLSGTLALLAVSIPLLLSTNPRINSPLICFLLMNGIANSLPLTLEFEPRLELYALAIWLPCYQLIPVSLWLYVKALTSDKPWKFERRLVWHLSPFALALVVSLLLIELPKEQLESLFSKGNPEPSVQAQLTAFSAYCLMVLWLVLSTMYLCAAIIKLVHYRRLLKHLFSNNDQRELHWLNLAIYLLILTWGTSLFYSIPLLSDQAIALPVEIIVIMYFLLLWIMSIFGIRQKPGFEGLYLLESEIDIPKQADDKAKKINVAQGEQTKKKDHTKYSRSALNETDLTNIASRLEKAMTEKQLYLDADLSLQKLAKEVSVNPNYLSQTLNQHIEKSFFDYINELRINHALPYIIEGKKTVLDIAMETGFNARSSFYKAFKHNTGFTPSAYRKQLRK